MNKIVLQWRFSCSLNCLPHSEIKHYGIEMGCLIQYRRRSEIKCSILLATSHHPIRFLSYGSNVCIHEYFSSRKKIDMTSCHGGNKRNKKKSNHVLLHISEKKPWKQMHNFIYERYRISEKYQPRRHKYFTFLIVILWIPSKTTEQWLCPFRVLHPRVWKGTRSRFIGFEGTNCSVIP